MNQIILSIIYLAVYLVLMILIFFKIREFRNKLNDLYFKKERPLKSWLGEVSFYRHILALVIPERYLKKEKIKKGYNLLWIYTALWVLEITILILFLKEGGIVN